MATVANALMRGPGHSVQIVAMTGALLAEVGLVGQVAARDARNELIVQQALIGAQHAPIVRNELIAQHAQIARSALIVQHAVARAEMTARWRNAGYRLA